MAPAADEDDGAQGFLSHLVELRTRLLYGVAAWLLLSLALIPFGNRLYGMLATPFRAALPEGAQMIAIDPASPFFTPLKLSFFVALIIAVPIGVWGGLRPGGWPETRYEAKARRQGHEVWYFRYRRR